MTNKYKDKLAKLANQCVGFNRAGEPDYFIGTFNVTAFAELIAGLEAAPPTNVKPVGELRCDATTGHVYGVHWYERCSPAIGTKVFVEPPADVQEKRALADFLNNVLPADNLSAIERLRAFCSYAMNGGDWLDVEPFFDDVIKELEAAPPADVEPVAVNIQEMVNKFLSWKLPADFSPDCGIYFTKESSYEHPEYGRTVYEPVGTNLLTATQAKEMFEYCFSATQPPADKDAERWKFVNGENYYAVCKYNDSPYGASYIPVDVADIDKAMGEV